MRKPVLAAVVLSCTLVSAPVSAQVVVETYSAWNGVSGIIEFGLDQPGDTRTGAYGQTFTAPAQYLNSWSFWLAGWDAGPVQFTANVAEWTGSTLGALLWTSGTYSGPGGFDVFQEYNFQTGGVSLLTGGQQYIFFLDATGGTGSLEFGWFGNNVSQYAGGRYEFNNPDDHSLDWDTFLDGDLVFRAEFDRVPTETVPEPASMTLLATGLAGMAAARRRKAGRES